MPPNVRCVPLPWVAICSPGRMGVSSRRALQPDRDGELNGIDPEAYLRGVLNARRAPDQSHCRVVALGGFGGTANQNRSPDSAQHPQDAGCLLFYHDADCHTLYRHDVPGA